MFSFDAESHTYRWNGTVVPSVTSILAPIKEDFSMVKPEVLEMARDRGKAVHRLIELEEKDDLDYTSIHDDLMPFMQQWLTFKLETGFELVATEEQFYDSKFGYAGTRDLRGRINGDEWLIDIKVTSSIPRSVGPQTAGYAKPLGDKVRRAVLHMRPDWERAKFSELKDPRDWSTFLSCLNIWKFNNA